MYTGEAKSSAEVPNFDQALTEAVTSLFLFEVYSPYLGF